MKLNFFLSNFIRDFSNNLATTISSDFGDLSRIQFLFAFSFFFFEKYIYVNSTFYYRDLSNNKLTDISSNIFDFEKLEYLFDFFFFLLYSHSIFFSFFSFQSRDISNNKFNYISDSAFTIQNIQFLFDFLIFFKKIDHPHFYFFNNRNVSNNMITSISDLSQQNQYNILELYFSFSFFSSSTSLKSFILGIYQKISSLPFQVLLAIWNICKDCLIFFFHSTFENLTF